MINNKRTKIRRKKKRSKPWEEGCFYKEMKKKDSFQLFLGHNYENRGFLIENSFSKLTKKELWLDIHDHNQQLFFFVFFLF